MNVICRQVFKPLGHRHYLETFKTLSLNITEKSSVCIARAPSLDPTELSDYLELCSLFIWPWKISTDF